MTGMKDYSDKLLNEIEEISEENTPNPDDFFDKRICPYCQNVEYYVTRKHSDSNEGAFTVYCHCPLCSRAWTLEKTNEGEFIFYEGSEVDIKLPPSESPE